MTIGNVSNMNHVIAAGRLNSPSMKYIPRSASPVDPASRPYQNTANLFYNSDGDRAEISNRARGLSILDPEQRPVGPGIINNYQFNLPNPLIDWENFNFNPVFPPVGGQIPVSIPVSGTTVPAEDSKNTFLPEITGTGALEALEPQGSCYTCENRKYVDRSDDASVSFQTPTNISPGMAAAAVASHENEHVRNEQARADREGREIVSQTVTLTYDTCPECGRHYVSGGTTKTTSVSKSDSDDTTAGETAPGESNE